MTRAPEGDALRGCMFAVLLLLAVALPLVIVAARCCR